MSTIDGDIVEALIDRDERLRTKREEVHAARLRAMGALFDACDEEGLTPEQTNRIINLALGWGCAMLDTMALGLEAAVAPPRAI